MTTKAHRVGEALEIAEDAEVVFPDLSIRKVTGGVLVLDTPGVFVVNGAEVKVK